MKWAIPAGRSSLGWAIAAWVGASAGLALGDWRPALVPAGAALLMAGRWRPTAILVGVAAAGMLSGAGAAMRLDAMLAAPIPVGETQVHAVVAMDPQRGDRGDVMVVSTRSSPGSAAPDMPTGTPEAAPSLMPGGVLLLVEADGTPPVAVGDELRIDGRVVDRSGRFGRHRYRARLVDADVVRVAPASGPFFGPGNRLRATVLDGLGDAYATPEGGLLAGFLVGDTSQVPPDQLDDLRHSGLTHYVAVSGSNVALFLAAWWLLVGPLQLAPRVRSATGLVVLGAFVVATRWEPSVVRAATMAAMVLGGRLVGIPVDPWRALGMAVTVLLLVSGDLAVDVGFQLSVAATAGVMVGVHHVPKRRPRWIWTVLWVTGAAQLAVLPILLWRFGSVPLFSPLANLVASPLVTIATSIGGIGALSGIRPLLEVGLRGAGLVLQVAERFAGWPQVGVGGASLAVVMLAALRRDGLRPAVTLTAVALVLAAAVPVAPPPVPTVTFLDVGQGDAIVIRDPSGVTALVDGGRDPTILRRALRRVGVGELDLVVVTHGDADHAGGLAGLMSSVQVGELWYPNHQADVGLVEPLLIEAASHGVPARAVGTGDRTRLGSVTIDVLGPSRRYLADNDGSVVLWLESDSATALLTGDAESVAQHDLPPLQPDLLQVPHHGSGTTDPGWLADTVGPMAVVSVGVNPYGHPAPHIVETLETAGAQVLTTRDHGDVSLPLCRGDCR